MKRALAAALLSGLFVIAVPQVVFADHAPDHKSGDCAGQTERAADSDHPAPDDAQHGDRQQHDGDGGEILF